MEFYEFFPLRPEGGRVFYLADFPERSTAADPPGIISGDQMSNPVDDAILAACQAGRMPESGKLAVGFSGGPDSCALLHAMARLARWQLVAVHVDHGLRAGSRREASLAADLARGWQVACVVERLEGIARGEEAARIARHQALARIATRSGAATIALAHHADDQLETLLLRLVRGAGTRGLGAMRPFDTGPAGVPIARPLLEITRQEIEAYCQEHGIVALEDPTNADPTHASRNLLRHRVVPALRELNPRAAQAAARTAELLSEDEALLSQIASQALAEATDSRGRIQAARLAQAPRAIARRMLRQLLPDLDFEQTEAVLAFASGSHPAHTHLPGGRRLARKSGRIWVEREGAPGQDLPGSAECRHCLTRARLDPSMDLEMETQARREDSSG